VTLTNPTSGGSLLSNVLLTKGVQHHMQGRRVVSTHVWHDAVACAVDITMLQPCNNQDPHLK
jgi:hypothetical protein